MEALIRNAEKRWGGPVAASRHLGIAYRTWAGYKSGDRAMPEYIRLSIIAHLKLFRPKTRQDILGIITEAGASSPAEIIAVLEDGAALADLGISDDDQIAVEEAYDDVCRLSATSAPLRSPKPG
jgi:hypothetical protein